MNVDAYMVGIVKTNTKGLCKDNMKKLKNYWPGGYYLMLKGKSAVPGYMPLITIGYKYNVRKVLYFISTKDKGTTKASIIYLWKYPESCSTFNSSLFLVSLSCLSYFDVLLRFHTTKKSQYDLVLE